MHHQVISLCFMRFWLLLQEKDFEFAEEKQSFQDDEDFLADEAGSGSGEIATGVPGLFFIFTTWVKVFRIIPEFKILRLTFHRKSASKC